MPQPSEDLRRARRAFEDLSGAELLGDWSWHEPSGRWALPCRLHIAPGTDPLVPVSTDWFFLVEPKYPWGDLHVHPAKEHGLKATFPHQMYNGIGKEDRPWTDGYVCTQGPLVQLGRAAESSEPFDADHRLAWHVTKTLEWLSAASKGQLTSANDPFELPHFPNQSSITIASREDSTTFSTWKSSSDKSGYVELYQLKSGRGCNHQRASPWSSGVYTEKSDLRTYCIQRFYSASEQEIVDYTWGRGVMSLMGEQHRGIWLRTESLPVIRPWQAPRTFKELLDALKLQGVDLHSQILPLVHHLRDGRRHQLLMGSPIPDKIGAPPSRIHWASFLLPVLSRGGNKAPGFRANEAGFVIRDAQEILRPDLALDWTIGENWSDEQLASRGKWKPEMMAKRFEIIGAGALGSVIAELLVRAGVQDLHIADHEKFQAGNSRRHTLGLDSLEKPKAKEVAERLNLSNPNARVTSSESAFPSYDRVEMAAAAAADVIVDCTANDHLLHDLAQPRARPALLLSLSLGLGARRLYCYAEAGTQLNHSAFIETTRPWLQKDVAEFPGELPREAIGCWHPVFPARADDVWALAALAAKEIERLVTSSPKTPELSVFEQQERNGKFVGVIRVPDK